MKSNHKQATCTLSHGISVEFRHSFGSTGIAKQRINGNTMLAIYTKKKQLLNEINGNQGNSFSLKTNGLSKRLGYSILKRL